MKKVRLKKFRAYQVVNRVTNPVYRVFGRMSTTKVRENQSRLGKRLWQFAKDNKGLKAFGRSPFSRRLVRRVYNLMSCGRFPQALGLLCKVTTGFRGWSLVHHRDGKPSTTTSRVAQVILRFQIPPRTYCPGGRVRMYYAARD